MPRKKKKVATMDTTTKRKIKNHKKLSDPEKDIIEYKEKRKKIKTKVFEGQSKY
jgi:hypothetical protein|tara:strand:+ start:397 stop:558 length:162 start_codon:yes stop_codon:yes gene_type:complete